MYLFLKRHARQCLRSIYRIIQTPGSLVDQRRIQAKYPTLKHNLKTNTDVHPIIERSLKEYVTYVSRPDMAISRELAVFLYGLCESVRPQYILDMGSGFSSYVFRLYQAKAREAVSVTSVDSDARWLKTTEDYLMRQGVSTAGGRFWPDFSLENEHFDLILHDLGGMETRLNSLPALIGSLSPNGALILDDVHKTSYRRDARIVLKQHRVSVYSLVHYTFDGYGRYAWLVTKNR
jgi:predicted O-methyltransferase YrrM